MGNDGGSIPKRRELVKEAARLQTASEVKESKQEQQEHRWKTCILSQQPLKPPIVSDWLGNLYNKDAILEFLLPSDDSSVESSKADKEKILESRVKSLKDVVEVKFHQSEENPKEDSSSAASTWLCPVSNKALGPSVKAVYLVPCGHAFSETAIREVSSDTCLQCNEAYKQDDIISILPTVSTEKDRLRNRADLLKAKGLTHALKKAPGSSKKRKKNGENMPNAIEEHAHDITDKRKDSTKIPNTANGTKVPDTIKNAVTASLTARVLAEEQEKAKRRKLDPNENLKSLFSSGNKKHKDGDFMTRGFSIPADARR